MLLIDKDKKAEMIVYGCRSHIKIVLRKIYCHNII